MVVVGLDESSDFAGGNTLGGVVVTIGTYIGVCVMEAVSFTLVGAMVGG